MLTETVDHYLDNPDVESCRHSRQRAAELITDGEDRLMDWTVLEFLQKCRHMAEKKAMKVIEKAEVSPDRIVTQMSLPEKDRLVEALKPFPS